MNIRGCAGKLGLAAKDLKFKWEQTETYWRDVKSAEFADKYVNSIPEHVARAISGEFDYDTMRWRRTKAFFAVLGEHLDDAEVRRREDSRLAVMERSWRVFDDTLPLLDWLRASGIKVAAVTNASGSRQRAKIAAVGLSEFFDHVVIAGELGVASDGRGARTGPGGGG